MEKVSSNFAFLAKGAPRLAGLGALAERYFANDAPAALIKLRLFGEFLAKDVAARQGVLPKVDVNFEDTLQV
jgi:type I restriction enzyme R subunit